MDKINEVDLVGYDANVNNFNYHIQQYKSKYSQILEEYTWANRIGFRHKERTKRFNKFIKDSDIVNSDIDNLIEQLNNQKSKLSHVIEELEQALKIFKKIEVGVGIHDIGVENIKKLKKSAEDIRKLSKEYVEKLPNAKIV